MRLSNEDLKNARKRLLQMHFESGVGHIGGNLSALDAMTLLHHEYLHTDKESFGYYGVTGNIRMLSRLRYEVAKLRRRWLQRRNRSSSPNWERFQGMLRVFPLFPARIIHSKMQ
jgi:hypothetical protein